MSLAGFSSVRPSHQTPPSGVSATLVKMVLPFEIARMAFGLVFQPVPGATPKKPYSGFTTRKFLSSSGVIQAISSPSVSAVQPSSVGSINARLVFSVADGNALVLVYDLPYGLVIFIIIICLDI